MVKTKNVIITRVIVFTTLGMTAAIALEASHRQSDTHQGFDLSAIPLFWDTVDTLTSDREPSEQQWSRMFDHPGYRQIQRSGQRQPVLRDVMPLVFMPSKRTSLDSLLASTDTRRRGGLYRRVAQHLVEARDRRADLQTFTQELNRTELINEALRAAREFLPDRDFSAVTSPMVYVLLFEPNGFGGETLALDLLLLMERSTENNVAYIGHELHHAYMGHVDQSRTPDRDDPTFYVYHSLSALYWEGIASLVDKPRYLDEDLRAALTGEERETADAFANYFTDSPTSLAQIDSVLAGIASGHLDAKEAGRELRQSLPWGGHPNGMYMARTIERAFDKDTLLDITDPFTFVLRYDDAAARINAFQFSPEVRTYIERLRSAHVN